MKSPTATPTPNPFLARCQEIAKLEAGLREGGLLRLGYAGQGGPSTTYPREIESTARTL